jgi:hypothetical protein
MGSRIGAFPNMEVDMSSDYEIQKLKREMEINLSATFTTVLVSATGLLIVAVLVTLGFALQHDADGSNPAAAEYAGLQHQERALFAVNPKLTEERRKRMETLSPEHALRGSETASIQQQKLLDFDDFEWAVRASD